MVVGVVVVVVSVVVVVVVVVVLLLLSTQVCEYVVTVPQCIRNCPAC